MQMEPKRKAIQAKSECKRDLHPDKNETRIEACTQTKLEEKVTGTILNVPLFQRIFQG